ncbi:MAG: hypothetical protein II979_05650, partial [Clostridia bacterium]|nr:hypothetical protein [Clostridia bacterium]
LVRMSLPSETAVQVGDRILSAGTGDVYPRGLVIGYVQSLESNPYTRTKNVYVQCIVPTSDVSSVMILTDFTLYAE